MAVNARIIPAQADHIQPIADNARQADIDELEACGSTPVECLEHGLRASVSAFTGMINDAPVCMFGVVPVCVLAGHGIPWMVGTKLLESHQVAFLRRCRPVIRSMFENWPRLENYVDDRNKLAIRWLKWLGFIIHEPVPYGAFGLPFRRFTNV